MVTVGNIKSREIGCRRGSLACSSSYVAVLAVSFRQVGEYLERWGPPSKVDFSGNSSYNLKSCVQTQDLEEGDPEDQQRVHTRGGTGMQTVLGWRGGELADGGLGNDLEV